MKHFLSITTSGLAAILICMGCSSEQIQPEHGENQVTVQFKVWGNCEMCQETIEESLKKKGITAAEWDVENKVLKVSYDSTSINSDQIQKTVAAAGYDTERYKADDAAYNNLHECCQYERRP